MGPCLSAHLGAPTPIAPTDYWLGGPLHHQLPNRAQSHPGAVISAISAPYRLQRIPASESYGVLSSISRGYPPLQGRLTTCYSAVRRPNEAVGAKLAWLIRTPIAVPSSRINWSFGQLHTFVMLSHTILFYTDRYKLYFSGSASHKSVPTSKASSFQINLD